MKTLPLAQVQKAGIEQLQKQTDTREPGSGFAEVLKDSIESVNQQMHEAGELRDGLIKGEHANIHETMIALEKSGISFQMMTKVQQKAIEAYKEVMRMNL